MVMYSKRILLNMYSCINLGDHCTVHVYLSVSHFTDAGENIVVELCTVGILFNSVVYRTVYLHYMAQT